jgi:hypothetical protein
VDVLFLGTSQTNNGFITSVFEQASGRPINSFNLGLPNNRYDVMLGYLQFHAHRFGKPRLVLVELSPSIQERNSMFYYLPALYHRSLIENDPTLAPVTLGNPLIADNVKKELLLSSASSLYQYRRTFSPLNILDKVSGKLKTLASHLPAANAAGPSDTTNLDFEGVAAAQRVSETFDPAMTAKGWYPKEQSPHMTNPEGIRLSIEEARRYYIEPQNEVTFDKLRRLLSWCRAERIPVVLVSWPNHPAYLAEFQKSRLNTPYQAGIRQLLTDYPVPLIDLNQEIPRSQPLDQGGMFADPRHLTPEGAQYFSRRLAEDLFTLATVNRLFDQNRLASQTR